MNTPSNTLETPQSNPINRHAERIDLMFRIEFRFENGMVLHGTTDNTGHGGLFASCAEQKQPCESMLNQRGECRLFLGTNFFTMPCQVKRVTQTGLGIHILEGYEEEFNRILDGIQNPEWELAS